jgi:NAD(P)-dependent dehydrogenase (short-subunit alcohol dehydrogenase family)
MKLKELRNLTVFITGGSSGIGLASAEALSRRGAHVVLFSRDGKKLESAIEKLAAAKQNPAQKLAYHRLDVSQHTEVKRTMEKAISEHGIPDVLINCAGRAQPNYFEEISFEQFDEITKVNLYGTWNTCSALVPRMKEKGRGYIVNVSSVAGLMPLFGYSDYAASKAGIVAFSKVLRSELKPHGITVSVLTPTDTDTPGYEEENKSKPMETKVISGWAKVVQPEVIARGLLSGMRRERFLIIPTFLDRLFCLIDRLVPGLVEVIMDGDVKKAQKQKLKG